MDLLWWAIIAFVVAVVAALLGFGGIARGAASISKLLFGVFIIVAIILLILAIF